MDESKRPLILRSLARASSETAIAGIDVHDIITAKTMKDVIDGVGERNVFRSGGELGSFTATSNTSSFTIPNMTIFKEVDLIFNGLMLIEKKDYNIVKGTGVVTLKTSLKIGETIDYEVYSTSFSYNDLADIPTGGPGTPAIADNLTTTAKGKSLDASQGKILNDTKADKSYVDAQDIELSNQITGCLDEIEKVKQYIDNGKTIIASAITDQGVETLPTDNFEVMGGNIRKLKIAGGAWQPHEDWINIREGNPPNSTVFLVADIYSATTCFILKFEGSGSATVDWGDGQVSSISSHESKRYHTYNIGSGKPCSLGYTTFKVTITPQYSNTIIRQISVAKPIGHNTSSITYKSNILWCIMGTNTVTSCNSMFDTGYSSGGSSYYNYNSPNLECLEGDFENVSDLSYMGLPSNIQSVLLENIKYISSMSNFSIGDVDNLDYFNGVGFERFDLRYASGLKRLPKINNDQLTSYYLTNVIITELHDIDLSTATQLRQFNIDSCVGINKIILSPESPITRIELVNTHITEGLTSLYESLPDRQSSGGRCDIRLNMVAEGLVGNTSIATKKGWVIRRSDY